MRRIPSPCLPCLPYRAQCWRHSNVPSGGLAGLLIQARQLEKEEERNDNNDKAGEAGDAYVSEGSGAGAWCSQLAHRRHVLP